MRIALLVEDDPDDIYLVGETFEDQLPDVLLKVAKHGDEAVAYLSGHGVYANRREFPLPSVLILDLGLPYRSGLDLLAWLRNHKDFSKLAVVVLTGSCRESDFDKATALGINAYFIKPNGYPDLVRFMKDPSGTLLQSPGTLS